MTKKNFIAPLLLGVFLAGILPLSAQNSPTTPPPRPRRANIVLILADGLGCDDIGCYAQRPVRTPTLDRMAAEGVKFTSFYAGSPFKFPARAALLTGRDSGHLGLTSDTEVSLPLDAPTFADLLKTAGYRTGCLGEWSMATEGSPDVPQKRGFIDWAGFYTDDEAKAEFPEYLWRCDPPNAGLAGFDGKVMLSQNEGGKHGESADDIITAAAKNFIHINKPTQFNHRRPFFLMLGYALPRDGGGDAVARLDANIGKILEQIKSEKMDGETYVFVTSDTGSRKKKNDEKKKTDGLPEEKLRVPLIAWCPAKFRSGEENYQPCAAWDFLPTFAEIGRAELPDKCDGVSFLQPLLGKPQLNRHEFLFWQTHATNGLLQAVRLNDWKGVLAAPSEPLHLFNLKTDRDEKTDVAKDHADVVGQIEDYLKKRESLAVSHDGKVQ